MKVVHPFRTGGEGYGLERNILCTLPGLVRHGVDVVALAVVERRSGPVPRAFAERLGALGVRMIEIESSGRLPFKLARQFSRTVEEERPDIIHSHDYKCDLAMCLAPTHGAVRMTTVHGWCSRTAKERFYEWLDVRCCRRMDAVVVFCEDYKRRLVSRGVPEALVRVIPVGLDPAVVPREGADLRSEWGVPDGETLVAQLGRLSREKAPTLFVQAAAKLSDRFADARFVLVGDGALRDELAAQIDALGKADRISLAGYVGAMGDVIDAIDIAVNCSTTEAIPRTLLEAGAGGVPAVATAVGGVPDAIDDGVTGILCPPGDVAAIGAGVARLLEDRALREAMGAAARQRVATVFDVEACTDRLAELYEELLA